MLHVALWEPEIPPNTGNIARLCLATATTLHLIGRLGFQLDDRSLRRAGLDYWQHATIRQHLTMADFERTDPARILCFSAHATERYTAARYKSGDCLLFGSESRGLPAELMQRYADRCYTIPMRSAQVRSLNLATAVGIVLYEALRQIESW